MFLVKKEFSILSPNDFVFSMKNYMFILNKSGRKREGSDTQKTLIELSNVWAWQLAEALGKMQHKWNAVL